MYTWILFELLLSYNTFPPFSVLISVWVTSYSFKRIFSILPDSRNTLLSTMDVLSLVSQKPIIDAFSEDGLIPVRSFIPMYI